MISAAKSNDVSRQISNSKNVSKTTLTNSMLLMNSGRKNILSY